MNACCVLHNICINHGEKEREAYIREGKEFLHDNVAQPAIVNGDNQENYNIIDKLALELFENNV